MPSLDTSSMVMILPELIILIHNDTGFSRFQDRGHADFEVEEIRNEVYHCI